MDPMGLPMYQHPRMTMMGQFGIDTNHGSNPIDASSGSLVQETMGIQRVTLSDAHITSTQEREVNKMPLQKEVDEEGRINSLSLPETPTLFPTDGDNTEDEKVSQEKIETEEEDDEKKFMEMAYDVFIQINNEELNVKEAAEFLGRPYSFVLSRYEEFCADNDEDVSTKKKKKSTGSKKKGKTKRKSRSKSRSKKNYQCEKCPAIFHTEYLLKTHCKLHEEGNESQVCTECGIVFSRISQLMAHRIESHDNALQCPHCDKQFTIIKSYKHHLKIHAKARPFICDECGKGFFAKSNLEEHYRMHTGERPFMCGYCEKTFVSLNNLKNHQYVHTGRANQPKNFECEECGQKYYSSDDLRQHINTHTGAKPFACDQCDARFNFRTDLRRHKEKHTGVRRYKCNYCPAAFFQPIDLKRHDMAHTGNKPFKCDQCDYVSSTKLNLKFHKYTHTGETPYKCDFYGCDAAYPRPSSLKHHKLSHGPPAPKICKVCNENFTDFKSLKIHMMLHSGEKPFNCDKCEKVFYAESSLNRHMATHMYKPQGPKIKQIRKRRKNPGIVKRRLKSETEESRSQPTQIQQPPQIPQIPQMPQISQHPQSYVANQINQYSNLAAIPYTPQVQGLQDYSAWPTTIDPDELRNRLLNSFK